MSFFSESLNKEVAVSSMGRTYTGILIKEDERGITLGGEGSTSGKVIINSYSPIFSQFHTDEVYLFKFEISECKITEEFKEREKPKEEEKTTIKKIQQGIYAF